MKKEILEVLHKNVEVSLAIEQNVILEWDFEKVADELNALFAKRNSSLHLPCKEEKNFEIEKKHKEWTDIPIEVSLRDFSLGFSECYLWLKNKMT